MIDDEARVGMLLPRQHVRPRDPRLGVPALEFDGAVLAVELCARREGEIIQLRIGRERDVRVREVDGLRRIMLDLHAIKACARA
jgi:hypothetical protein